MVLIKFLCGLMMASVAAIVYKYVPFPESILILSACGLTVIYIANEKDKTSNSGMKLNKGNYNPMNKTKKSIKEKQNLLHNNMYILRQLAALMIKLKTVVIKLDRQQIDKNKNQVRNKFVGQLKSKGISTRENKCFSSQQKHKPTQLSTINKMSEINVNSQYTKDILINENRPKAYDRLITRLQMRYANLSMNDALKYIDMLKFENNGKLSGVLMRTIYQKVGQFISADNRQKLIDNKNLFKHEYDNQIKKKISVETQTERVFQKLCMDCTIMMTQVGSPIESNLCTACKPKNGKQLKFFQFLTKYNKSIEYFCGCTDCLNNDTEKCIANYCSLCTAPKFIKRYISSN